MIVRQETDGTFSIYIDDNRCLKSGVGSNAEAWRLADLCDDEAGEMEDTRRRISKAFSE